MLDRSKPFGHFEIVRMLGRGGMGVVYLARDERLGRDVALKVLSEYDLPDGERRTRFLREARAAAAVRHPNIATIYEVGEAESGEPFIAMEYCEGQTLSQIAAAGPVDPARFMRIARQLAAALAAAHQNGVIHRDIKSANVIVEEGDVVKVLDFGLAKLSDRLTDSATPSWARGSAGFFGTVPYISPEQARGRPADDRSDLFSLGVVLYELATGRLPFEDDNPLGVLEKIRDQEPQEFKPGDPTYPPQIGAVIARLLQKNALDRFQSAEELAEALEQADAHMKTGAVPKSARISVGRGFGRTVRSHTSLAAVTIAAVAFVLLAVATVVFLARDDSRSTPSNEGPIKSLAVLPLRNVSGQTTDQFLSVGIADALVTRLQQVSGLQVRPTSSVLGFTAGEVTAKDAAKDLGVDAILEGHFMTSGPQVRVNLQLTDTRTGYGVWAGSVDGRRTDLIGLMDQVSTSAASAFETKQSTTPSRSKPVTDNQEAYELYLKARAIMGSLIPEHYDQHVALLQKAIELDPEFAAAYADLAIALSIGQTRGFGPDVNVYDTAERFARQAVRLDPNLPDAHLALGRTLVRFPDRYRESVRENLAALRLDPQNPYALHTVVSYFVATGDLNKIGCVGDRLVAIDPSSNNSRTRGYWHINAVNPEEAIRLASEALRSEDTALAGHDIFANAYIALGDLRQAEIHQKEAARLEPKHYIPISLHAMISAANGDETAAQTSIDAMRREAETSHWAALRVAQTYAKLGRRDDAIEWLRTAAARGNHSWYFMVRHPWLQPLQGDPEFQEIIGKMKADLDDVRDDVVGVYEMLCGPE
ncbi:MAG: protein kinase domain-containing protein [Thermoanaerobaculia bacterium]